MFHIIFLFCCKHLEDISTSKNTDTVYRYRLEQHYNPSSPEPHTNELIPLKQNLVFRRCPLDHIEPQTC